MTKLARTKPGSHSAALAGLALLVLSSPGARAEPPGELEFGSGGRRVYTRFPTALDVFMTVVKEDKDGRPFATGADSSVRIHENGALVLGYTVAYPDLRHGELFPVMGRVYRVEHMAGTGPGGGKAGHIMVAKLVPPKDVPKGVTLGARTFVVPYVPGEQSGTLVMTEGNVRFVEYNPPADGKGPAALKLGIYVRNEDTEFRRLATVKVGDVVLVGGKGFKVLSLTPPDKKTQVIGWIELDPKGIPEKELVEKKIPFVRPEIVEKDKK